MPAYPPAESLILTAVMPSPRDLEIARLLGWYRIPLRSAPKVVDVDYLAFYQTDAFGVDHRWRIEYFAGVRGHELTTRGELFRDQPDHPRSHEEYYKIQIAGLQPLPVPIRAERWKRVTFLYTTGDLLQKAETINDLVVHSEERQLLWRSLRERALQAESYRGSALPENELDLDPEILVMLGALGGMTGFSGEPDDTN
ncbi:MAG: hypothetical protein LLG42_15460 [Chloroflexi bacterium]|nr:hypothetical protein [Chloroflexota bacterium]